MTTVPPKTDLVEEEEDVQVIYCGKAKCEGSTGLRCVRTDVPICSKCAVLVKGVGYISEDAARAHEKKFYNIGSQDYVIAAVLSFFSLLVLGFLFTITIGAIGFFSFLLAFFLGPSAGGLISEIVWRAIGNRRGKYTGRVVSVAMGSATLLLILISFGGFNFISALIFGGLATSTAAARFQLGLRV